MSAVLRLDELKKVYLRGWGKKPVDALRGISLEVHPGEVFGFIGPNGAGKSTTIKILTGAMAPTSGIAEINGLDVRLANARQGLGYVPENPYLNDYLTPMEVLKTGVRIHGLKPKNEERYCMEWLEKLGLAQVHERRIRTFSKGMTQRVVLAHALALQPKILILDEPLSGLDPVGRKEVVDLLAEYKKGGGTLFFTSHVLYDVERLADRFGLIHKGKLKAVCAPSELIDSERHVVIRSSGANALPGQCHETSNTLAWEVSSSELWQKLDEVKTAGQTLIEVRPSMTLEAAFMKFIAQEAQGD